MLKTAKATAVQRCVECYEDWRVAKAKAADALQTLQSGADDESRCEAHSAAQTEVGRKSEDLQEARVAVDAASTALDDEYIKRQPDGKAAMAILKRRRAALDQEVKRCAHIHISCQKAVERAMQSRKHNPKDRFAILKEREAEAYAVLQKATVLAQASSD